MKFTSILLCAALLLLLLAGCKSVPEAETLPESGGVVDDAAQISLVEQMVTLLSSCLDTQEGFYCGLGSLLYFCPKNGDRFVPLCGKANCKHNDANCNAAIDSWATLGYYDGGIYSIEQTCSDFFDFNVVKRNLDGTDHKTIATVKSFEYGFQPESGGISWQTDLYRGKAYITLYTPWGTPGEHLYHMSVVNLADGSQTEFGAELFRNGGMEHPSFRNGKMYGFAVHNVDLETGKEDRTLMEVDLETGAATEIPIPTEKIYGQELVTDSTVYYMERESADEAPSRLRFKEYDRVSGAIKDYESPVEITTDNIVRFADDFIYVLPDMFREKPGNLYFLSRDYKLVDQIELRENLECIAATKDRVYFTDRSVDPEAKADVYVYYLEKSQIGSHSLKLEKLPMLVAQEEWNYFPDEETQ